MRQRITAGAIALVWSSVVLAGCTETPTVAPAATRPALVTDFSANTTAGYRELSAGWFHTCALKTDGSLACWGGDIAGAVSATPPGADFAQVSAGANFTCAVRMDASLVCWGFNGAGQTVPPGGTDFTRVSSGGSHACAFRTDGSLTCWGDNSHGEATPPAGISFIQVTTGNSHTCALKTDGSLACWGDNSEGQATPPGGTNFAQVSAGAYHTCAVRTDASLACWGRNLEGQATPPAGATFAQVSGGHSHTCAVRKDGSLACWGSNLLGQATPPAGANFARVSAGAAHTCALRTDGSLACWGDNYWGQATPPLDALLDQEQPVIDASDGTLSIGDASSQILAQVVTPAVSGLLAEVRFPVACSSGGLIVEVQGVAGGVPNGVVLASRLVDGSTLPTPVPSSFRSLVFTTPPTVSAGVPFAIVLRSPGSCGVFPGPTGDSYRGGDAFFDARPNPPGWVPLTPWRDLPFQTLVAPNPAPPTVTPQDAIESLMADVRTLVADGVLNAGQGNGSLAKLAAAILSLDRGSTKGACNQLQAFVNQVSGVVGARQLSAAAGQELIDAAEAVRSQLGCGSAVCPAPTQGNSVLVDASRDGGVWWAPQAGPFSPESYHQGQPLADYLRGKGYAVQELARGMAITEDLLLASKIVIRANDFGSYTAAELQAYQHFLACPRTLLLLADYVSEGSQDQLAEMLGVKFTGAVFGYVTTFAAHPITSGVVPLYYNAGAIVDAGYPSTVHILGWLSTGEPVMGVVDNGTANIFFIGDVNGIESVPQPLVDNLINWGF